MAKDNDTQSKEKKKGFFERNGFVTSSDKEEVAEVISVNTSSGEEFNFNFDAVSEVSKPTVKPVQSTPTPVATSADPKIAERLKKVLSDSNFPGPDYFEFKQQLDALSEIIVDESTRYKAAYKSLVVQGVTKEKITDSAKKYVSILSSENSKFSEAISQKSSTDIDLKTQEAKLLNTENVSIKKQIDELNSKVESNNQKIKVLASEVQKSQTDISEAKKRFEHTLNVFVNEIKTNADKVENYI